MTRHPTHLRPRGFTFIEVLFAIIILGIGSIMIAGMLPVAIKQTSDTRNAITGKAACEAGYAYIQAIATASNLPATNIATGTTLATLPTSPIDYPTLLNDAPSGFTSTAGKVLPLSYDVTNAGGAAGPFAAYQSLTGSRVLTTDPRTQWLAFYSRDQGASVAKLIVLAIHLQNTESTSAYVQATPTAFNTLTNRDNGPSLLTAELVDGGLLDADTITLTGTAQTITAAETGAFVIVADSPSTAADPTRAARNNGRVFRLGKFVTGTTTTAKYELQPGYDLPSSNSGVDGIPNTTDDDCDGSMNTLTSSGATPASSDPGGYRVSPPPASKVAGAAVQVWLVGKGLLNPANNYNSSTNPYVGLVQDVSVLTTQLQLPN